MRSSDIRIMNALANEGETTTLRITELTGLNHSTINRRLRAMGPVIRQRMGKTATNRVSYWSVDPELFKQIIKESGVQKFKSIWAPVKPWPPTGAEE